MWPNPQKTADLVTFTEEILNGKLHFLRSVVNETKICEFNIIITFYVIMLLDIYGEIQGHFLGNDNCKASTNWDFEN